MIAASVANAVGVDVERTNISKSSAWLKTQQERVKKSEAIRSQFEKPEHLAVHWDGKILKVKGNKSSNRVCVYITGTDSEKRRKLLGIPETESGTGEAEFEVVRKELMAWNIKASLSILNFFNQINIDEVKFNSETFTH